MSSSPPSVIYSEWIQNVGESLKFSKVLIPFIHVMFPNDEIFKLTLFRSVYKKSTVLITPKCNLQRVYQGCGQIPKNLQSCIHAAIDDDILNKNQ